MGRLKRAENKFILLMLCIFSSNSLVAQKLGGQPSVISQIRQMSPDLRKVLRSIEFFNTSSFLPKRADTLLQECQVIAHEFQEVERFAYLILLGRVQKVAGTQQLTLCISEMPRVTASATSQGFQ